MINDDENSTNQQYRVILIVEDNIVNRLVLTGFLDSMKCKIVYAENGAVALEQYISTPVDLILMDINMPVMDGIEATKRIRKIEIEKNAQRTPIVAVTARVDDDTKQDCNAAGMDGFVSKPIKPDFLIGVVSKWMH